MPNSKLGSIDLGDPGTLFLLIIVMVILLNIKWISNHLGNLWITDHLGSLYRLLRRSSVVEFRDRNSSVAALPAPPMAIASPPITVPGGGQALLHTPNDETGIRSAVTYMDRDLTFSGAKYGYNLPLGWYVQDGRPELAYTKLIEGGADNVLYSGMKNSGKDNAMQWATLCLMEQHPPDELQLFIIDTKGVDWGGFKNKAHTFKFFKGTKQIPDALKALQGERERREKIVSSFTEESGVRKWSAVPKEHRPPLLLIIITEISMMVSELGQAETGRRLNDALVSWRAFGGHILLGTQFVNNMDTGWRGQIPLLLAGAQNDFVYDKPSTRFTTERIKQLGAVPPSELPPVPAFGGVFLLAAPGQKEVINVRSSFITDEGLVRILRTFPSKIEHPDEVIIDLEEEEETPRVAHNFEEYRGKATSMSDEEILVYMRRRRMASPGISRSAVLLELWGYTGGSADSRGRPLWDESSRPVEEEAA
jgi:hypothetical protein